MESSILLVEDEPGLRLTLADLLTTEGYGVETSGDGIDGLVRGAREKFDLIILDVMLPGKSGLEVCKGLRQMGCDTAILMLTAKVQVADRVVGLRLGADDYLAKPFDPHELLARVEALLRRVPKKRRIQVLRFEFGDVVVDFAAGKVTKAGLPIPLAAKELLLLRFLIDRRNTVVTRSQILETVWECSGEISSRTIDVHVAWLRQKLEDNPQCPQFIQTARRVGYRFTA